MQKKKLYVVFVLFLTVFAFSFASGCGSNEDNNTTSDGDIEEEPPIEVKSTEEQRLCPTKPAVHPTDEFCNQNELACKNPALYDPDNDAIGAAFSVGFGELQICDGEPAQSMDDLHVEKPNDISEAETILSFFQISDIHICDEESPVRAAFADSKGLDSALRPQDMMASQVFDAVIRTINSWAYYHPETKFIYLSGDLTDSAQKNETEWFLKVLEGGEVNPDSGNDDDPIAGPNNDPQDPFTAEGAKLPYYIAIGNHDGLVLGNTEINSENKMSPAGDWDDLGTRNGSNFSIVNDVVPDENRQFLLHNEMIEKLYSAGGEPTGHGFTQQNVDDDTAYYYFDMDTKEGQPKVRFIVLDTTYRYNGYAGSLTYVAGVVSKEQVDDFMVPAIEDAMQNKMFVIVTGHHPLDRIQDDGEPDKYYTGYDLEDIFHQYPNVIAYLEGHSHKNRVLAKPHPSYDPAHPEYGFWEVQAASLADWPMQFRLYELKNWKDGVYSLKTVVFDFYAEDGSIAQKARQLALIDVQSGWSEEGRESTPNNRNGELFFQAPQEW